MKLLVSAQVANDEVWPYACGIMAVPSVKATYSLDPETVRKLEDMARRLGVSKSEALRRAIRSAAGASAERGGSALRALDALQRSVGLNTSKARSWVAKARAERKASSSRGDRGR